MRPWLWNVEDGPDVGIRPDRSGGQYLKQRRARDAALPGASKPLFATAFVLGLGIREASEGLYVQRSFLNNVARPPSKDLVIARATGCWRRIVAPPPGQMLARHIPKRLLRTPRNGL